LITDSGAPPHEMMQYDRDQNTGWQKEAPPLARKR
jgi:hypothetical protein